MSSDSALSISLAVSVIIPVGEGGGVIGEGHGT